MSTSVHAEPGFQQQELPSENAINIAVLRRLIRASFTPGDLRRFCQDSREFRPVLNDVSEEPTLNQLADALVDYCEKTVYFPELLQGIKTHSPRQYAIYRERLYEGIGGPWTQRRKRWSLHWLAAAGGVAVLAIIITALLTLLSKGTPSGTQPATLSSQVAVTTLALSTESIPQTTPTPALTLQALTTPSWTTIVGLINLADCPADVTNDLYTKIQNAFDPPPKGLDWQTEPAQAFRSAEEARAWAETQDIDLLVWGRCPQPHHVELMVELISVPQAPEMAELAQVSASADETRLFYLGDLMIGLVAYAVGDYAAASERWNALIEIVDGWAETEPDWESKERVQLLLLLGNSRVYAQEYGAAEPIYRQALEMEAPLDLKAAAGNNLGVARYAQQMTIALEAKQLPDLSAAIQAFSTTLELDPSFMLAYLNRAEAYMKQYEWDTALRDCEQALALSNQQSPTAFYCRGIVQLNRPESAEAEFRADMDTALRLSQRDYAPPYYMLAVYYEMHGTRDQAQENYQAFLERLESRPYLMQDRQRIERALAALRR